VIAGAITPSGPNSNACLCGYGSQDGAGTKHGWKAIGGWKFGNTIDGCQAEFVCVPDAMANLERCAGGPHGRASPDVPGHNVDGLQRRRERGRPDWGYSSRFCPGAHRTLQPRQAHGSKVLPPLSSSIRLPNGLPYRGSWEPDFTVDFKKVNPSGRDLENYGWARS